MNGGTCVEDGDKFKCVCLPWTAGNLCEGLLRYYNNCNILNKLFVHL